jgi:hypothetical protein
VRSAPFRPQARFHPVVSRWFGLGLALAATLLSACQNYSGQLLRAQSYYQESHYDQALAVFQHLETDLGSLDAREQVRYQYLRGMTDLRLGYLDDARYWLALATSGLTSAESALTPEEAARLKESLAELNKEYYARLATGSPGGAAPKVEAPACQWSSECDEGFICKNAHCAAL